MAPKAVVLFQPASREEARAEPSLPAGFIAAYVGTHGMAHGMRMVPKAAHKPGSTTCGFLGLCARLRKERSCLGTRNTSEISSR
ncbi:MAG: hypothetical protein JXP73_19595 [Deltaproteobacteria bacterium]|nr:hypothetical protein [Deltaproteobacteria bacterium]